MPHTILPTDQSSSYAAIVATSNQAAVSAPEYVNLTQKEHPFTPVRIGARQNNNK